MHLRRDSLGVCKRDRPINLPDEIRRHSGDTWILEETAATACYFHSSDFGDDVVIHARASEILKETKSILASPNVCRHIAQQILVERSVGGDVECEAVLR